MNLIKIKETCLYIHDLESARKFYHDLLGLAILDFSEGKHIFFKAGSSVLLCFNPENSKEKRSPPSHFAEGKQHFAFEVKANDYEKAKAEILQKGIKLTDTLTWKNGLESFYFEDFDGNVLEVVPEGIWD